MVVVTSHRQPRQCRGGAKTVKGAQGDPNYVSRLLARSECLPGGGGKNYSYAAGHLYNEKTKSACTLKFTRLAGRSDRVGRRPKNSNQAISQSINHYFSENDCMNREKTNR